MYFRRSGQSLTEYSIVIALIAVSCIGGLTILGNTISRDFNAMLPSPQDRAVATSSSRAGGMQGGSLDIQNGGDDSVAIKLNGSKVTNDLMRQYSEIVLTAGSLGDEKVLYGNSTKLVEYAKKLQDTEPELFNRIVKLGLVGKQMGQVMTKFQTNPDGLNDMNLQTSSGDYDFAWADVHKSPEYARLSREDQAFVWQLANESVGLADQVLAAKGAIINADKTVDENSDEIIVCGINKECK